MYNASENVWRNAVICQNAVRKYQSLCLLSGFGFVCWYWSHWCEGSLGPFPWLACCICLCCLLCLAAAGVSGRPASYANLANNPVAQSHRATSNLSCQRCWEWESKLFEFGFSRHPGISIPRIFPDGLIRALICRSLAIFCWYSRTPGCPHLHLVI